MIDDIRYWFHKITGGKTKIETAGIEPRRIYDSLVVVRQITGQKLEAYRLTVTCVPCQRMVQSKSLGYPVPVVKMNDGIEVCGYVTGRRRAPKMTLVMDPNGDVPPPVVLHECAEAIAKSHNKKTAHQPPYKGKIWGC